MICTNCGTENPEAAKFCNGCGAALGRVCATCGTSNPAAARFCSECAAPLVAAASPGSPRVVEVAPSVAERRLVSVLFVDLVGFTVASESRDAEDTRELLVRYFEIARTTIESDEADRLFKGAAGLFRELAFPFYLAVTLLEHAEWLLAHDRIEEAEPMLAEGHAIFERLEARPWLERSASAGSRRRREVASRQEA